MMDPLPASGEFAEADAEAGLGLGDPEGSTLPGNTSSQPQPPGENEDPTSPEKQQQPQKPQPIVRPALRGSGSYPSMIRARTANRNKITKRNSESSVILTGGGSGVSSSKSRPTVGGGGSASDSKKRRHHHPLHKKKSVYSRATRRKSLENLGLLVRTRCGTAKLQWPSEKKETDVFDLLPEGCLQVRQLRMRTPKGDESSNGKKSDYSDSSSPSLSQADKLLLSRQDSLTNESISGSSSKTDWKSKRNISVIVRIRPKQNRELEEKSIVFRTDSRTIVFDPKEKTKDFYFQGVKQSTRNDFGRKRPNRNVSFHYDKVYGPEASNRHIFNETLQDLTDHLIEGFNSTVFAYGATGSGKTYTMIGSNSNPGLIVLMVETLYKRIDELAGDYECDVVCSYLEVYNETIKDLLKPEKELYIREDGKKRIIIPELTYYNPRGPTELLRLLRAGNRCRTQHATDLNAESSRSHAVFEVKLCLKRRSKENPEEEGPDDYLDEDGLNKVEVIQSKLVMVDLAGSERGTAATGGLGSGASSVGGFFMDGGARQREGASINKSLLALANCISALADGKCHIPYRNSKLTRLLKDALSGNCTTVMIANISPSNLSSEDTYNTLKYADRAKNIVGPGTKHRNVFLEDLLMEDGAKSQMAELQAKVIQLEEMLEEEKLKNERMMLRRTDHEEEQVHTSHTSHQNQVKHSRANNMSNMGGGDADSFVPHSEKIPEENQDDLVREDQSEFPALSSKVVTEAELPEGIQKYLKLIKERAAVYSEYVQFASEARIGEWSASCKKLKADMADLLGRLPVSDENYVSFCKLKNEVNHMAMACRSSSSTSNVAAAAAQKISSPNSPPPHIQHKKYAMKLKNLTEKLELVRLDCIAKNLLSLPDGGYMANSLSPHIGLEEMEIIPPSVSISLDEFLQFKRLLGEQEGNDKMEHFYQQFSQQINGQLITSGMTLMHALKLVKRMESLNVRADDVSTGLLQEFKELSDFIYGPNDSIHSATDSNNNPSGRPQSRSQSSSISNNLGRRSTSILEDLHKLKKIVEQPLLIPLTCLLCSDQDEEEDEEEGKDETEDLFLDKGRNEDSAHDHREDQINALSANPFQFISNTGRRKSFTVAGEPSYESPRVHLPQPPMTIASGVSVPCPNYEDSYESNYHLHPNHNDINEDVKRCLPAQVESAFADESSSKETLLPSDPETQPSRRRRRAWTRTTYENGSVISTAMSSILPPHIAVASAVLPPTPTNNPPGTQNPHQARKSKSHASTVQPRSQHNSDYDWCTASSTGTATSSTLESTTASSSASTSAENVIKRGGSVNTPNLIRPKSSLGNKKQLASHQQPSIKELGHGENESAEQDHEPLFSAGDPTINPKYTYRLESPSEVMQAYSAAHKEKHRAEEEVEATTEEDEDDHDGGDSSSDPDVSHSSSVINTKKREKR